MFKTIGQWRSDAHLHRFWFGRALVAQIKVL